MSTYMIGGAAVYEASHIGSGTAPAAPPQAPAAAAAVVMNPLGQQEAPAAPPQVFVGVNNPNNSVQVGVAQIGRAHV